MIVPYKEVRFPASKKLSTITAGPIHYPLSQYRCPPPLFLFPSDPIIIENRTKRIEKHAKKIYILTNSIESTQRSNSNGIRANRIITNNIIKPSQDTGKKKLN